MWSCWYLKVHYIFKAYCIGAFYLIKELYGKYSRRNRTLTRTDLPLRREHVAIVTGGASGIGLEAVHKLLIIGFHVIIGAPLTEEDCRNVKNKLNFKSLNSKVIVWPLDLSSMESIKSFVKTFKESMNPLHVLINNAGVMYVPYRKTENGFEEHFQVNYLGHCLLTKLLLPILKETATPELYGRIVNTSSSTHFVGDINFDDLQSLKCYSPYQCYLQSKLAIVLHTYSLQRFLEESDSCVTVNCLHPGVVDTNLYKHVWWAKYVGKFLFKTPKEGAETVVYAAVSPAIEQIGGKYLEDCQIVSSSKLSTDQPLQNRLWEVTNNLLGIWIK